MLNKKITQQWVAKSWYHKFIMLAIPLLAGVLGSAEAGAQCTPATLNWDWQYKQGAFTSGVRFAVGINSIKMDWSGAITTNAVPSSTAFTGYGSGYGAGRTLNFNAATGTITLTFKDEVSNVKFSLYDLDNGQSATVSATNAASIAQNVTMALSNASATVTLAGTATNPSATGTGAVANTATSSGINVDIAGPVKTITIALGKTNTTADDIFLSDISACITGNFVNGFDVSLAPEPGAGQFLVAANSSNSIYAINVATGAATKLFTDAALTSINSLAYDAYKQQFYYCSNVSVGTNKSVYRYDLKTCTRIVWIADVTVAPYNMVLNAGGLGAGAASYSNGSLFLGADVNLATTEDHAIWRFDIDDLTGNPISAARTFGTLGYNATSTTLFYDWGDFVIADGTMYNFNRAGGAAPNTNILHYDLNAQDTTAGFTNPNVIQAGLDYYGNVYNVGYDVSMYDKNGNLGAFHTIAGDGWAGPANDAAEYFKFPADYSDAPVSYGRPYHQIRECSGNGMIKLGATVDYEVNPNPVAAGLVPDGDDNANYTGSGTTNDEDGFTTFPILSIGAQSYTLSTIPVTNTSGAAATLNGWIDFNQDGLFSAAEYATATIAANATTASLTWNMSAFTSGTDIVLGNTYARFRIQKTPPVDSAATLKDERATTYVLGGEVEDYRIEVKLLTITGKVFKDPNGLSNGLVDGIGVNSPSAVALKAYLVQGGNVVAVTPVAASGTYSFDGIANQNDTYAIIISTGIAAVGNPAPASASLPSGWAAVGDAFGTFNSAGTGNESGVPDAAITVNTASKSITGVNFGIEQVPVSNITTVASQINPGAKNVLTIANTGFTGSDPDTTTFQQRHFTTFPVNVDSISIAGVGYTAATWPAAGVYATLTSAILIDPVNGAITATIPFSFVDHAGKESLIDGAVNQPLTDLTLSGTVYDDNNGGTISGTPKGTIGTNVLYANLENTTTGLIVGSVPVNSNGTYSLGTANGIEKGTTFRIYIATTAAAVGDTPPGTALNMADNTAEGTTAAGTGPADGIFQQAIAAVPLSIPNINFAINQYPAVVQPAALASQLNPGGLLTVSIPTPATKFTGLDPEDGVAVKQIHYISFPSNVTSIKIGATSYMATAAAGFTAWPAAGVTVLRGTTVDIDPVDGVTTANIPYRVIDSAAFESFDTASLDVPFTDLMLSGTVYDDGNGSTDNLVNGIATNSIAGNAPLYAVLCIGNTIKGYVPVNADGTYSFGTANGLQMSTTYSVKVTGTEPVGATLITPTVTGAVYTGEGILPAGDATADGITAVTVTTVSVTGVNFGLDILPVPINSGVASQFNPGGAIQKPVAASLFTGTDEDGTVAKIHITAGPTAATATSFVINGQSYTTATFPAGGLILNINSFTVTVDPVDGVTNPAFTYKVIDDAGKESLTTATVTAPFRNLGISGVVYDDPTGTTDGKINGTKVNVINGTTLYAYLVNYTTNAVIAKQAVAATTGYYDFDIADGIVANTNYKVVISGISVAVAAQAPTTALTGVVNTAEGNTLLGDGYANGIDSIFVGTTPLDSLNFGLDILPIARIQANVAVLNPGGTNTATIPFASWIGAGAVGTRTTDADGIIKAIRINAFPTTNVNGLVLNGTYYTNATFPAGGLTVTTTDVFGIDPVNNPSAAAMNTVIPFFAIDNADKESTLGTTLTQPFTDLTISGRIYDDPTGGAVDGTGSGIIGTNTLYANLVDSTTGLVVATIPAITTPAATAGNYSFGTANGVKMNTTYYVTVTNTPGVAGNTPPSQLLTNAVNTAEGIGLATTGDLLPDGKTKVAVTTASIPNILFGIDLLPVPTNNIQVSQVNPGGTTAVGITAASVTGTDADGTVAKVHYTTFPTFTTTFTIGAASYTAATWPVGGITTLNTITALTLDPMDGTLEPVITFALIDNAGKESATTGTVRVPFTDLMLAGNVLDDNNAGPLSGTAMNPIGVNNLHMNLVNTTTGKVVGTTLVAADGSYSFGTANGIRKSTAFTLSLSDTAGVVGSNPPSVILVNAGNTGEGLGTVVSGAVDGTYAVTAAVMVASITNINFGVDQYPTPVQPAPLAPQVNPGGTTTVSIPAVNFGGTDPEDGAAVKQIHFTAFPANVTSIKIGATSYTLATFPVAGVTVLKGTTIDIDPKDSTVTANIPFKVIDSAGFESITAASLDVPFTDLYVTGNIYDDGNGLTDNIVNGTPIASIASNTRLYAVLVTNATNAVVGVAQVDATGKYYLGNTKGVKPNSDYKILLSATAPALAAIFTVPTVPGTVYTGEGIPAAGDGTANGITPVSVIASNITGINFGVNTLPVAVGTTLPSQTNPGTAVLVPVATSYFTGTDADGTINQIHFTTFPANATSVVINSVPYISTTFPVGGVTVPVAGLTVTVSPSVTGNITSLIPFKVIDNIGLESTITDTVLVPFRPITVNGRIYDDHNGITDSLINGTPTATISAQQLYVYLLNSSGKILAKKTPLSTGATAGYYEFTNVDGVLANTNYSVIVTNVNVATIVSGTTAAPAITLLNAKNTAEGNTTTGDGLINGSTAVSVLVDPVDSVNFGIDVLPTARVQANAAVLNPGGTSTATIAFASFIGAGALATQSVDPDGVISAVRITTFPAANVNRLVLNGTAYTSATFPAGGLTVLPTDVFGIDPVNNPSVAAMNTVLPFVVIDDAGKESTASANFTQPFTDILISGTVYNDKNGGNVDGTATNKIGTNTMYANLVDTATGLVLASTPVAVAGTYSFGSASGVEMNKGFNVIVTKTLGIAGQPYPSTGLTNAVNTNEGVKTAATNPGDGLADGITLVKVALISVPNVDFGIEQLPTAAPKILATQVNPGGGTMIPVAAANFSATDPDAGTVTGYRLTAFPGYIDSMTVGTGVTAVTYTAATWPVDGVTITTTTPVSIDPWDGEWVQTHITIPYAAIDNAGQESFATSLIEIPLTELQISGVVKDDPDGGAVTGTATNVMGANTLYAHLISVATGKVIASQPVAGDGTFQFLTADGVMKGVSYTIAITNAAANAGDPTPANSLVNAVNTADGNGTPATGDGTPNGQYTIPAATMAASVTNLVFGIDQLAIADVQVFNITPPALNSVKALTATNGLDTLSGTDPEDGIMGTGKTIVITSLVGMNSNILKYNNVAVTVGTPIPNYNPALLTTTFANPSANKAAFTYAFKDAAAQQGAPATYSMVWGVPLQVKLTAFNAMKMTNDAQITWSAENEVVIEGYEVEHSLDGRAWSRLSETRIDGKGEGSYKMLHIAPGAGTHFYRLRSNNTAGTATYSAVRTVTFDALIELAVYPNPVSNLLNIRTDDYGAIQSVQVLDAAGKLVIRNTEAGVHSIDVTALPAGVYHVIVERANTAPATFRINKQ